MVSFISSYPDLPCHNVNLLTRSILSTAQHQPGYSLTLLEDLATS